MLNPWYNYPPEIGLPMLRRLAWARSLRPLALLMATLIAFAGLTLSAPAGAVSSVSAVPAAVSTATITHTPWTGERFPTRYICVQNNIGTTWAIDTADNYFESGSNTVVVYDLFPGEGDPPCSQFYYSAQILHVSTYNSSNATCYQVSTPATSNGRYTDSVVIGLNVNSSANYCRDTAQHRNNVISQALGYAFGLAPFYSCSTYASSIMNDCHPNYNFAGTDDRNSLYWLY